MDDTGGCRQETLSCTRKARVAPGAEGHRTEHIKSGGEKRLAYFLLSRFFFSFFHAYNTPRKYGANRSSGGGGGGVVWVVGVEVRLWGGAKESSRKRYLSCECTYGGTGEGELVMFGGEREGADEPAVIFARGARRSDQRSLLQSRGLQCVERPRTL